MTGFRAEAGSNRRLFRTYRRMVAPEARGLGLARAMEELGERFLIKEGLPGVFYAQVEASSPSNRLLSECGFALTAVEPAVGERAADLFVQKIGVCSRRTGRDGLAECGVYGVGRPAGAKDRRRLRRARFVRRARSGLERRGR